MIVTSELQITYEYASPHTSKDTSPSRSTPDPEYVISGSPEIPRKRAAQRTVRSLPREQVVRRTKTPASPLITPLMNTRSYPSEIPNSKVRRHFMEI